MVPFEGLFSLLFVYLFVILDGKTKVSNFAAACAVQKYVVWLDVKVQDFMAMQEFQALYQYAILQEKSIGEYKVRAFDAYGLLAGNVVDSTEL